MDDQLSSDLVASLFEAALDDLSWSGIAARVAAACGVGGGAIIVMRGSDIADMSVTENILSSAAPYEAHYKFIDPWRTRALPAPMGSVRLSSELFPEEELVRGEFYNDFARKVGMFRPLNAYVRVDESTVMSVGVEEPYARRLLDHDDKPLIARIAPYLGRAMQLRLRLRSREAGTAAGWAIIDRLAIPAVVCDRLGTMLMVNEAAESIFGGMRGEAGSPRTIAAPTPDQTAVLLRLIGATAGGGPGAALQLVGQSTRYLTLVTPLPSQVRDERGLVLVTMREAASRSFDADLLREMFGLSATQAALAVALYDGSTPDEFADGRGIRISTVRTHLAEVLARMGATDQRELVALLGRIPPIRR